MQETIQLICSDIDGTLLNKDRALSALTCRVIQQLHAQCGVVLASSRMPAAMRHLQADLGIANQPLVCYNGAYLVFDKENETVDAAHIPIELVQFVLQAIKAHVSLYHKDDWWISANDEWAAREMHNTRVQPTGLIQAKSIGAAHKIMCMGTKDALDELERLLADEAADALQRYRSKDSYLELAPAGASKATALAVVGERLGVPMQAMMAFGDNYNDIEMLRAVGIGVAVANAKEALKQVADAHAEANISDGVARYLMQHFGL
jgi:Cof subfamily protein (haloacid dehalogenase superfamily)